MEKLHNSYDDILDYIPMLPQLKIEKDAMRLSNSCITSSDIKSAIVTTTTLSSSDILLLNTYFNQLISLYDGITINSNFVPNRSNVFTVSSSCSDISNVISFLSEIPQVVWVEEQLEKVLFNRWATGICQSTDQGSTPIFDLNITGAGIVIGIADTGLDMNHCSFYDPDVAAPYDTVNTAHRKVIYYDTYVDNIDGTSGNNDDGNGHGTHVCGSAAGKSYLDYGDYKKYDGNAHDAKIAFFDIGTISNGVCYIVLFMLNYSFK